MAFRFRLLPAVIVAASGLLCVKLVALGEGGSAAIATAWAQGAAAPPPAPAAPPAPLAAAQAEPPVAAPAAAPAAPPVPSAEPAAAPSAAPAPSAAALPRDPLQMSPEEIGELQQLAERRTELDKRAAELNERAVLLQAAEKRIDAKIAQLQSIEKTIEASVKVQDDQEEAKVQSLAHMYEQMKPQEAARILDQLDVPVILTMLAHMRELKAAPILATMDPAKAKAVTLALTEQRGDGQPATPAAAAPPAAPGAAD